jgi:putative AdoMet-dependent methyltransferase
MRRPLWQWDEMRQAGTDYTDIAEVERYDRRMSRFRDFEAEAAAILKLLSVPRGAHILEIGTGTGHFARAAAKAGYRVTAIDVSPVMLAYARAKARAEHLAGIRFRHAGFLTFRSTPAAFDAVVSVAVLHHLPDMWKAVALQNVHRALKPGGRLFLGDVVFSWKGTGHAACFDRFTRSFPGGMEKEAGRHVAQEYSTLDWVMKGLLARAGFSILRSVTHRNSLIHYLCGKR